MRRQCGSVLSFPVVSDFSRGGRDRDHRSLNQQWTRGPARAARSPGAHRRARARGSNGATRPDRLDGAYRRPGPSRARRTTGATRSDRRPGRVPQDRLQMKRGPPREGPPSLREENAFKRGWVPDRVGGAKQGPADQVPEDDDGITRVSMRTATSNSDIAHEVLTTIFRCGAARHRPSRHRRPTRAG